MRSRAIRNERAYEEGVRKGLAFGARAHAVGLDRDCHKDSGNNVLGRDSRSIASARP